jgi:hypothetical protein
MVGRTVARLRDYLRAAGIRRVGAGRNRAEGWLVVGWRV